MEDMHLSTYKMITKSRKTVYYHHNPTSLVGPLTHNAGEGIPCLPAVSLSLVGCSMSPMPHAPGGFWSTPALLCLLMYLFCLYLGSWGKPAFSPSNRLYFWGLDGPCPGRCCGRELKDDPSRPYSGLCDKMGSDTSLWWFWRNDPLCCCGCWPLQNWFCYQNIVQEHQPNVMLIAMYKHKCTRNVSLAWRYSYTCRDSY